LIVFNSNLGLTKEGFSSTLMLDFLIVFLVGEWNGFDVSDPI